MHYYQTNLYEPGQTYPTATAHNTLDEAIEFATANGIDTIYEIGGNWDEWEKCWFCGEWFPTTDLDQDNTCHRCRIAIKDHESA